MEISPLYRLLTAYAPKKVQEGQRFLWAFDARMADIIRSTSEPMIGQMRLTWWYEALSGKASGTGGAGEPLMEALRRDVLPLGATADLLSPIEGWEVLLEPLPLSDSQLIAFAEHRGGGLFRAMGAVSGDCPPWLAQAGMAWALWDFAGHVSDADSARRAMMLVPEFLSDVPRQGWSRACAPLRILTALVRGDAEQGRKPPAQLSSGQYVRIICFGLLRG